MSRPPQPPSLDDAWEAVEAALPDGWVFECGPHGDGTYWAQALAPEVGSVHPYEEVLRQATPAVALFALAAKLRTRPSP